MRAWRLVRSGHARTALSGQGAALYGGRWNPVGVPLVYLGGSLALATLELVVHLAGARVRYVAIELDLPDQLVDHLAPGALGRTWRQHEALTQRVGEAWVAAAASVALLVPSALVDPRSGEHNVLLNPRHPAMDQVRERQRFDVVLDERLGP